MHLRAACAAAALATAVAGVAFPVSQSTASAEEAARRFAVTARISTIRVATGETARIFGKVRPASPRERVVLQHRRRGQWAVIDTTRLGPRSRYAFRVKASGMGRKAYRVVKPRSGAMRRGTSPAVHLTSYQWVPLKDLSWLASDYFVSGMQYIAGDRFRNSIYAHGSQYNIEDYVVIQLARKCWKVSGTVGLGDNSSNHARAQIMVSVDDVERLNDEFEPEESTAVSWNVTGDSRLRVDTAWISGHSTYSAVGNARALCSRVV